MSRFRVPPFQRRAFELLASAERALVESLLTELGSLEGDLSKSRVAKAVSAALEVSEQEGHGATEAVLGVAGSIDWTDVTLPEFINELSQDDSLSLETEARAVLVDNMLALAVVPQVSLLARAASLLSEDERSLCTARTVSDIRPVFSSRTDTNISGALIHHTLKMDVHHDGNIESHYITVSRDGLARLRDVVERAIDKHESLRQVLAAAQITILEVEEEH